MNKLKIYNLAFEKFGFNMQMRKLQEECGELIAATNRLMDDESRLDDFLEELADVEIMIEQARLNIRVLDDMTTDTNEMISIIKNEKLKRLYRRLKEVRGEAMV